MRRSALVFALFLTPLIAHAQGAPAAPRCGDGVLQPGEACDDGNNLDGDGCSSLCQAEVSSCGDGVVVSIENEECDDGNRVDGDGCSSRCQISVCGDGVWAPLENEDCDDGNTFNGDGCDQSCHSEAMAPALSRTRPPGRTKSPGLALGLALGGTVVSNVLFYTALASNEENGAALLITVPLAAVGPSLGHFYTGHGGRGALMSGLRLGTPAVAFIGAFTLFSSIFTGDVGSANGGVALIIGAGGAYYALALVDIIHAPLSAQRFNERPVSGSPEVVGLPFKPNPAFSLLPTPLRGPDGSAGLGLSLGGRF